MKVSIKKAEISDIHELNKISVESKKHWNYPQEWIEKWWDELTLREKDFLDQSIYKLVDRNGIIIGFCLMKEHKNEYEIMHLWIKPSNIRKGYGKYLLNESIQRVVIKEKPIIVEADSNAESFYARQGFIMVEKRESYPKGRFLPVMKKIQHQ